MLPVIPIFHTVERVSIVLKLNWIKSIPSQTPPHRKVTGERNKTGGVQQLKTRFFYLICYCLQLTKKIEG